MFPLSRSALVFICKWNFICVCVLPALLMLTVGAIAAWPVFFVSFVVCLSTFFAICVEAH
jgi:hypothetical protein